MTFKPSKITIAGTWRGQPAQATFHRERDGHAVVLRVGERHTSFRLSKGVKPCATVAGVLIRQWLEEPTRPRVIDAEELKPGLRIARLP